MKKLKRLTLLLAVLMIFGCNKPKTTDPAPAPSPTPIPVSTYITATVFKLYGKTFVQVQIKPIIGTTLFIRDAQVTINGKTMAYDLTSEYYGGDYGSDIPEGTTVTLDIISSVGNFTASAVMPGSLKNVSVLIPGAADPSKLTLMG